MGIASGMHRNSADGRLFLQLTNGQGWVPECSRKDASKVVVTKVDEFRPCAGEIQSPVASPCTPKKEACEETNMRSRSVSSSTPERPCRKRSRWECDAEVMFADSVSIAPKKMARLTQLVAQTFARLQQRELRLEELLEEVTGSSFGCEDPLTTEELQAGMSRLEALNKVMTQQGHVILVS